MKWLNVFGRKTTTWQQRKQPSSTKTQQSYQFWFNTRIQPSVCTYIPKRTVLSCTPARSRQYWPLIMSNLILPRATRPYHMYLRPKVDLAVSAFTSAQCRGCMPGDWISAAEAWTEDELCGYTYMHAHNPPGKIQRGPTSWKLLYECIRLQHSNPYLMEIKSSWIIVLKTV